MTQPSIQNAFSSGEVSPSLFGRTDLAKNHIGAATMRNMFVNYRGGANSRAGLAYVLKCKQPGTSAPPRDIPFQFNITQGYALEFGDSYMRIKYRGAYVTEAAVTVSNVSSVGLFSTNAAHNYNVGDWVYNIGNTGFGGLSWIVASVPASNQFTVTDLFGVVVGSAIASTGGSVSRIYTVSAPYAAVDLPYLKYTQSADTMSLTCVNTATQTEYPPYELKRLAQTNWTFAALSVTSSISAPTGVTASVITAAAFPPPSPTYYSYVVTAVNDTTGEESIASQPAQCYTNDIAVTLGTNTITWNPVVGATSYNVYKATPALWVNTSWTGFPVGCLYGYLGTALGTQFVDTNITADFTHVPPTQQNPFARGAITQVNPTAGGSGYVNGSVTVNITTSTGSGAVILPVVINGAITAFIIQNGGSGYAAGDTISFTQSGASGATANLVIGPQTGTYPGAVAYFQQRRVYAASLNNPDTYWMSQPGAFHNFDYSIPVIDSDAITGTPWSQQINGVQFMIPMPGGLVVLTGKGAWQVTGGTSAAITPANENATPQAYNGCNNIVVPVVVNYDIIFVQSKGSIFRDFAYNFFTNIYTGTDLTVLSNHLFTNYTFNQIAWTEEPYKLLWAVRNDGALLSLTYLKEQDVYAWSRHDTNGLVVGVCSVTEPPVDALYVIVQRFVNGQWVYYSERMDNRNWNNAENCFCVDSGIQWPQTFPNATLNCSSSTGGGNITSTLNVYGGSGYTNPSVFAVDPTGSGTGATFGVALSGGSIVSITPLTQGSGYAQGTTLSIVDSTGTGAVIQPVVTNYATFTASSGVFNNGSVGQVIRMGGGVATVTSYVSSTQVIANITTAITQTIPNDPANTPAPATSGSWSITPVTTSVSGLNHLEGKAVSILADGSVVSGQTVTNGTVTLPSAASYITVGLPYTCQLQTLYLDPQGQPVTTQSRRKTTSQVAVRVEASRGWSVGCNQVDASTQPGQPNQTWSAATGMVEVKERNASVYAGNTIPLATGDFITTVKDTWNSKGQVAIQQTYPLPLNVLSLVTYWTAGDSPG